MNDLAYRNFFLQPRDTWHRRYEALRVDFVEQQPLADVARRFDVSYGTVCNWVSQFRAQGEAKQRPPFFFNLPQGGRRDRARLRTRSQTSRSPTSKRCH